MLVTAKSEIVARARSLATHWHAGQVRKYPVPGPDGEPIVLPYVSHCEAVAARLSGVPDVTDSEIAAAWLHDVIEDTTCPWPDIEAACGAEVLRLVLALTNRSVLDIGLAGQPRAVRKAADMAHLAACDASVRRIKMIDRTHNLGCMTGASDKFKRLYLAESERLLDVLRDADEVLAGEYEATMEGLRGTLMDASQ